MKMPTYAAHIANFNMEECARLIELCYQHENLEVSNNECTQQKDTLEQHPPTGRKSRGKGREDVYAVLTELIRSWAADPDLHDSDAYVIEACRKICNVMGWTPTEVA